MRARSRHSPAPSAVVAQTVSTNHPLRITAPRGRKQVFTDDGRRSLSPGVNGRGCAASLQGPITAARYATGLLATHYLIAGTRDTGMRSVVLRVLLIRGDSSLAFALKVSCIIVVVYRKHIKLYGLHYEVHAFCYTTYILRQTPAPPGACDRTKGASSA
jgi:hypothetical protein